MFWFIAGMVAVVWLWPVLWFRVVRGRLEVTSTLLSKQVEQGSSFVMRVTVRNASWLPCPSVTMILELPAGLSTTEKVDDRVLNVPTYVMARQKVTFDVEIYGQRRGLYDFRNKDAVLMVNEGMGLRDMFLSQPIGGSIVVLPAYYAESIRNPVAQELSGRIEISRWLHPDETLVRGVRPYVAGDAIKSIDWHASARTATWLSKQFSSSTDLDAACVLNAQFFDPFWNGTDSQLFEHLCSCTATWAAHLEGMGLRTALATNAVNPGSPRRIWYGPQRAAGTRELLGRLGATISVPFDVLIRTADHQLGSRGMLLVFAGYLNAMQVQMLVTLTRSGRSLTVIAVTQQLTELLHNAGVAAIFVGLPGQILEDRQHA